MTGIIKTDQIQGAQGTTVTVPTGHTLAVTSNATVGGTLAVTGAITGTSQTLNRANTDGELIGLQRGGSAIGSIGTANTDDLYILNADTGLMFSGGSNMIIPRGTAGAARDNAINLGAAFHRFKDLYLSGGLYVGGTGAANKLDDYEEGTWTPTYVPANGSFGGSYLTQIGRYTKIGRKVTVEFQLVANFSNNTQSGNVQIGGLPFTASAQSGGAYGSLTIAQSTRFSGAAPKAGQIAAGGTSIYVWTNLGVTGGGSDQTQLTTSNFILSGGNPNNIVASMTYLA
tara:strand:- start:1171 stop:2025 length:855 start_codon:yes stop_codon:yes gene_type:complete